MVQIDPKAAAAAAPPPPPAAAPAQAPGTVVVNTPSGGELALEPGRQVVARVVEVGDDDTARISLAGQTLVVQTDSRLRVGDAIQLSVERADATQVRLAIVPASNLGAEAGGAGLGGRGAGAGGGAAALIGELARAGVPVTPELAKAIATIADQLGAAAAGSGSATDAAGRAAAGAAVGTGAPGIDGAGTGPGTAAVGRALASLAGRDIALTPAAAGRVAAAVELAGSLGPALASLAERSPTIAAALPAGPPTADALRSLLTPGLEPGELAIARIVQAGGSGGAGAAGNGAGATAAGTGTSATGAAVASGTTPAQASAIRSYVAAQVATEVQLDTSSAQRATTVAPTTQLPTTGTAPTAAPGTGLAGAATEAAIRGVASAGPGVSGAALELGSTAGDPGRTARLAPASSSGPVADADVAANPATAGASSARATATASAATGAATAMPTQVAPRVAQAVADLGALAARFAADVAPATGVVGAAGFDASRGTNATQVAQAAGRDGAVAAQQGSNAGAAASGDPAPVITAINEFLASPRGETDTAKLLRTIAGTQTPALARAIQTLPEHQALQVAGALLDALPGSGSLSHAGLTSLRLGVHAALQDLGRALHPPLEHDVATLRHALEQVAATDPRPAVAQDAARMLSAMDGQQLISRTATGADPGYLYFQVPMPDGRGAEVMVRRDAARRDVTFDEFNIAFLLNTERLGTLMISLDAQPSGIRADIKTDAAGLGDLLQVHADALAEPLSNAARRPVTITTGTFDDAAPSSLLDHVPTTHAPGGTSLYA